MWTLCDSYKRDNVRAERIYYKHFYHSPTEVGTKTADASDHDYKLARPATLRCLIPTPPSVPPITLAAVPPNRQRTLKRFCKANTSHNCSRLKNKLHTFKNRVLERNGITPRPESIQTLLSQELFLLAGREVRNEFTRSASADLQLVKKGIVLVYIIACSGSKQPNRTHC